MMSRFWVGAVVLLAGVGAQAREGVLVRGTKTEFPSEIQAMVGGKAVKMVLTGTALRKRLAFHIYAMASYVKEGVKIQTPEDLAACASPKRLELVMLRDVSGKEMAEAFKTGINLNHPGAFADEITMLQELIQKQALTRDDHVVLTSVPAVGLHCNVGGKMDVLIKNVKFSQAVWEIYLGKNNLGDKIRDGLVSGK